MLGEVVGLLVTAVFLLIVVTKVSLRFLRVPEVIEVDAPPEARSYRAALQERGFEHIGDYQITMAPGAKPTPFSWLVDDDSVDQARVVVQSGRAFVELQRRFDSGFSVVTDNGRYAKVFAAEATGATQRLRTDDVGKLIEAHENLCSKQSDVGEAEQPDVDDPPSYVRDLELAQLRVLEGAGMLSFDERRDQFRITWGGTVKVLARLLASPFSR